MLLDEVVPTPWSGFDRVRARGDIMVRKVLHGWGDALIRAGVDRSVARQQFERNLAGVHPGTRGYAQAVQVARSAALFESALLWLGWRLQPRSPLPELLDRS